MQMWGGQPVELHLKLASHQTVLREKSLGLGKEREGWLGC